MQQQKADNRIIYIMGVSGCGKSSIGTLLAAELSIPYIEGDDHHPQSNVDKMRQGIPLDDSDRLPWLDKLHSIATEQGTKKGCVIACSALKESYRVRLMHTIEDQVSWVYLKGSYDLIHQRMKHRKNHFMDANMLRSQFDTLEEPEYAIEVDISGSQEQIVKNIKSQI